jgi:hypothetical protein
VWFQGTVAKTAAPKACWFCGRNNCISQANGLSEKPSTPVHIHQVDDLNIGQGCRLTMSRANDSSTSETGPTALCGLAFAMNDIAQSAETNAIRFRTAEARRKSQSANICCTQPALVEKFDSQQSLRVLLGFMQHHVSLASNANGTFGASQARTLCCKSQRWTGRSQHLEGNVEGPNCWNFKPQILSAPHLQYLLSYSL